MGTIFMLIDFKKAQEYHHHFYGELNTKFCLYSEELKLGYVPIAKNMSKVLHKSLRATHLFTESTITNHSHDPNVKWLILLREPIDRWYSGTLEYLRRDGMLGYLDDPKFRKVLTDGIMFDLHTMKQIMFLDKLNTQDCLFFDCSTDISDILTDYLYKNYNLDLSKEIISLKEPIDPYKIKLVDHVTRNIGILHDLRMYYREDLTLFRQIDWIYTKNDYIRICSDF